MFTFVGKLWTRSQKLAYTLLNKLSTRNEPLLVPGDRVSHEIKLCSMDVSCMLHSLLQTILSKCSARISSISSTTCISNDQQIKIQKLEP